MGNMGRQVFAQPLEDGEYFSFMRMFSNCRQQLLALKCMRGGTVSSSRLRIRKTSFVPFLDRFIEDVDIAGKNELKVDWFQVKFTVSLFPAILSNTLRANNGKSCRKGNHSV